MKEPLTKQQLMDMGINVENLNYPNGDMNIIVQSIAPYEGEDNEMYPDIYQPRKNRVWSYRMESESCDMTNDDERNWYICHLKDSAERLKILAHGLLKQAEELETLGVAKTSVYYPM